MKKPVLHAVTTGKKSIEETASICLDISPHVEAIHIREHTKTAREIYELGKKMIDFGIPADQIIINNRVDVAAALGICPVQLGYHSLPVNVVKESFSRLSIGKSVHSLLEAVEAEEEGADYILFGHVYPTSSKKGLTPRGLDELTQLISNVTIPVIAIGGILPSNAREVIQKGCSGIAVMSGIFDAVDPVKAAIDYQNHLELIFHEQFL
ncbi:thiazole tautomerase TenI [Bacillus sp. SG-1]|uniref:thiazole tautomerase TenI n=1 Tax=Bacillus sp. SG-1 TaxID=161544 RepID=UPI0001543540|nr:thiazole tautomerase TenI [Bacillus sp. SG-1]EDL65534.1 transcriptional regulator TenI [Bacillus sp. SG-1]